jgi:poly(A) polymerase
LDSTLRRPLVRWEEIADLAIFVSRYDIADRALLREVNSPEDGRTLDPLVQQTLLVQMLEGRFPKRGLDLLQRTGFIDAYWPELAPMYGVGHAKEHHPEGNLWQHTLETFAYRKQPDLLLSLGLLLHDCGKPQARPNKGRRFDRHAQIGARIAEGLLRRLGFAEGLVSDVSFLVREHMLPAFVAELPTFRTERIMSSQLFPLLLELYRCDLSSTYRGPEGYYRACRAYRSFLKNVRNPFRTADGRKLLRTYLASR